MAEDSLRVLGIGTYAPRRRRLRIPTSDHTMRKTTNKEPDASFHLPLAASETATTPKMTRKSAAQIVAASHSYRCPQRRRSTGKDVPRARGIGTYELLGLDPLCEAEKHVSDRSCFCLV